MSLRRQQVLCGIVWVCVCLAEVCEVWCTHTDVLFGFWFVFFVVCCFWALCWTLMHFKRMRYETAADGRIIINNKKKRYLNCSLGIRVKLRLLSFFSHSGWGDLDQSFSTGGVSGSTLCFSCHEVENPNWHIYSTEIKLPAHFLSCLYTHTHARTFIVENCWFGLCSSLNFERPWPVPNIPTCRWLIFDLKMQLEPQVFHFTRDELWLSCLHRMR